MKRIIINVQDNIYDPIINILELLGKDKVEIISSEIVSDPDMKSLNEKIKKILADNKTKLFKNIEDPVMWQRKQRDEWD